MAWAGLVQGSREHPSSAFRVSRRLLRLGSGLVLFTYITMHFTSHALGLVSLAVADRALALAVAVWHSVPGSVALYGAAAVHVALAFQAVYERRTLRMPPLQALRIAMGFGMPLLVIGHVVATRMAADLYGLAPTYSRIVWALWLSNGEGRQLALLAPGWIHGCLGLELAFGRRAAWQRLRPACFGLAVLLPVLAGLGFLAMGRELAALAPDPMAQLPMSPAGLAQAVGIGRLRDHLLATYLALVAGVFVAREVRAQVERRRHLLLTIRYPKRRVVVPRGWTVLEASRSFGIPHLSQCGGRARCSTCRVRVVGGTAECPLPTPEERQTLDRIGAAADVRLACQLRPQGDIAVEPLLDAGVVDGLVDDSPQAVVEREVAILRVKVVAWNPAAQAHPSAHDIVYALNQFLASVGHVLDSGGGSHARYDGDGASALFGMAKDVPTACRQALSAATGLGEVLDQLNGRLEGEVGLNAAFVIAVHTGVVVIGPVGHGRAVAPAAVGEAVFAARALCEQAAAAEKRFAISRAAMAAAGGPDDGIDWRRVEVCASRPPIEAMFDDQVRAG